MVMHSLINNYTRFGIDAFLKKYPLMSIRPTADEVLIIEGYLEFNCVYEKNEPLYDRYKIRIKIDFHKEKSIPVVYELENRIPKKNDFHIYSDNSLCLGSPIRLLNMVSKYPSLTEFTEMCIIPHLYSCSIKLQQGGAFVIGELEHGNAGLYTDYMELFNLQSKEQVYNAVKFLSMKKRIANKQKCLCGCGYRFGYCKVHHHVNLFRKTASRAWFRMHYYELCTNK